MTAQIIHLVLKLLLLSDYNRSYKRRNKSEVADEIRLYLLGANQFGMHSYGAICYAVSPQTLLIKVTTFEIRVRTLLNSN